MIAKFVSDIKKIENSADKIYAVLSDFDKLVDIFKEKSLTTSENQQLNDKIRDIKITNDSCILDIENLGEVEIKIVDKEPYKTIKMVGGESTPYPFKIWIQLVEKNPNDTRMRLTLHAKMNYVTRMMIKSQIQKSINYVANAICRLPY